MVRSCYRNTLLLLFLISLTALSGFILSSSKVSADDTVLPTDDTVIDEVNVTVPVSCSLTGSGMTSHRATINNGTYATDIGTTTFNVYCNDKDGFAIYAIGYTDDTDGKNVLTSSALGSGSDINTGTGTTGNSQWAVKLTTDANATYPLTIQNDYNAYHTVPNDYELVAKRTASTDIGAAAVGSSFTSTYQVFISSTQAAGTYLGQVKYTLVHPNNLDVDDLENTVTVIYHGNGSTFNNGTETNEVEYVGSCETTGIYVGNTPTISKTTNIANDGTMNTYNSSNDSVKDTVTFSGADKLIVELTYGYDYDGGMFLFTGIPEEYGNIDDYEGDDTFYDYYWSEDWEQGEETTTIELTLDTDTVSFMITRWDEPAIDYYGYYAKVYPVYDEVVEGTTYQITDSECSSIMTLSGGYEMLSDAWSTTINNNYYSFNGENEIKEFIANNMVTLAGTTIHLYEAANSE